MERLPQALPPLSDPLDQRIAYLAALIAQSQERELVTQKRLDNVQGRVRDRANTMDSPLRNEKLPAMNHTKRCTTVVRFLLRLTQEKKIIWHVSAIYGHFGPIFTLPYSERSLALYQSNRQEAILEYVSADDLPFWRFPRLAIINELLQAVQYQVAEGADASIASLNSIDYSKIG